MNSTKEGADAMYDLDALIRQGEDHLCEQGYSQSSINHYALAWERLRAWCEENATEGYDLEVQNRYFAAVDLADLGCLSRHWRSVRTFVETLISLEETGEPPKRKAASKYEVPDGLFLTS